MRGKLRDKRIDARRDKLSRQLMERRRGTRRESRAAVTLAWQNQLLDEEDYDGLLDGEKPLATKVKK
jgi:hypothetical protein